MLQQLAQQLKVAAQEPNYYRYGYVPFLVAVSFILVFWLIYSGVSDDLASLLPQPTSAATEFIEANPAVELNGFLFDHEINRDFYFTPAYEYPS